MSKVLSTAKAILFCSVLAFVSFAQSTVPRLVSFSGIVKDASGKPLTGPVSVSFSLYTEQEGGTPLWSETQNVQTDAQGQYSVFLGAMNPSGLPLELFTTGAARWLAVEPGVPAASNLTRILLVGVPYALKAADADTLGGKPASAFVTTDSPVSAPAAPVVAVVPAVTPATTPTGGGTTDYVPLWTSGTNLGNSILYQASGRMEVQGELEAPSIGTASASTGYDSQPFDLVASAFSSALAAPVAQHFRWQAEPVGNDTSAPAGKIDLLYALGTATPAETGLSISSKGVLTFAAGQTFPGTGAGTIKGVTAGTDLTGGGTSGNVTLNLDTSKVPQLNSANAFTGSQTVTGNITTSGNIGASGNVTAAAGSFSGTVTSKGLHSANASNVNGAYGVYGAETGNTNETIGVRGYTASPYGNGVYGEQGGKSKTGAALFPGAAVWGDANQTGGTGVQGTVDDGYAGYFANHSDAYATLAAYNLSGSPGTVFYAQGNDGHCSISTAGNLSCSGSKSAVVPVDNGTRKVALYAVEAPENWFEDFGSGQLSNGLATVTLDLVFAQTVNTDVEYHVFLTPNGDSKGLYVSNKTAAGFEVHESAGGRSTIDFDYRIVARRKGYETIRLADKTTEFDSMRLPRRKPGSGSKPAAQ
jgi:hypothetical protein